MLGHMAVRTAPSDAPAGALGGHGRTGEVGQVKALCLVERKGVVERPMSTITRQPFDVL